MFENVISGNYNRLLKGSLKTTPLASDLRPPLWFNIAYDPSHIHIVYISICVWIIIMDIRFRIRLIAHYTIVNFKDNDQSLWSERRGMNLKILYIYHYNML